MERNRLELERNGSFFKNMLREVVENIEDIPNCGEDCSESCTFCGEFQVKQLNIVFRITR